MFPSHLAGACGACAQHRFGWPFLARRPRDMFGPSAGNASMEQSTRRFRLELPCLWRLSARRFVLPNFSIFVSRFWAPKLVPKIVTRHTNVHMEVTILGTRIAAQNGDTFLVRFPRHFFNTVWVLCRPGGCFLAMVEMPVQGRKRCG